MEKKDYMTHELLISEKLFSAVKDFLYESEYDLKGKDINDFIVDAIIVKFNKENKLFYGKVDKDGFMPDDKYNRNTSNTQRFLEV